MPLTVVEKVAFDGEVLQVVVYPVRSVVPDPARVDVDWRLKDPIASRPYDVPCMRT